MPRSRSRIPLLLLATPLGFLAGDSLMVMWRAPSLLQPAHLSGFLMLLISGAVLYGVIGMGLLGLFALLWLLSRALRRGLSASFLAVATPAAGVGLLFTQEALQRSFPVLFHGPTSPLFYLPTVMALAIVVLSVILVHAVLARVSIPRGVGRAFAWPGLVGTSGGVLVLYALMAIPGVNVLGVYSPQEQRSPRHEHAPISQTTADQAAPNFLFLVVEAFRFDEFTAQNAPFLWSLAQENVWFTNYRVVAPATRPSVTSFFTSLYPVQHGVYGLWRAAKVDGDECFRTRRVAETIETFPRLLQQHGYRTSMLTSNGNTTDRVFGFEDVFVRFDAAEPHRFPLLSPEAFGGYHFLRSRLEAWRVFKMLVFSPQHSTAYVEAPRINAAVRRELRVADPRPFCMYVHYIEPHSPYYHHPYRPMQINAYRISQRKALLDAYRSELRAVDGAIADLFGFLEAEGLLENTYVLITADHGEEFYDHGSWGHGKSLHPEVIRVPAILVNPAAKHAARRVDNPVENIDVAPTVSELARIGCPETWEGRSLVPYLGPGEVRPQRGDSSVADSAEGSVVEPGGATAEAQPALSFFRAGESLWASAVWNRWQIVTCEDGQAERTYLFDLAQDPMALHDLSGLGHPQEDELLRLLEASQTRLRITAPLLQDEPEVAGERAADQLRTLGYID